MSRWPSRPPSRRRRKTGHPMIIRRIYPTCPILYPFCTHSAPFPGTARCGAGAFGLCRPLSTVDRSRSRPLDQVRPGGQRRHSARTGHSRPVNSPRDGRPPLMSTDRAWRTHRTISDEIIRASAGRCLRPAILRSAILRPAVLRSAIRTFASVASTSTATPQSAQPIIDDPVFTPLATRFNPSIPTLHPFLAHKHPIRPPNIPANGGKRGPSR